MITCCCSSLTQTGQQKSTLTFLLELIFHTSLIFACLGGSPRVPTTAGRRKGRRRRRGTARGQQTSAVGPGCRWRAPALPLIHTVPSSQDVPRRGSRSRVGWARQPAQVWGWVMSMTARGRYVGGGKGTRLWPMMSDSHIQPTRGAYFNSGKG